MKLPDELLQALKEKKSFRLQINENGIPSLYDDANQALWILEGFDKKAAFLFIDNFLEEQGYQLIDRSALRWKALDIREKFG